MRPWSLLAYGCEGEPKERGGKRHDGVKPLPRRKLPPLDIAGSNKERKKDAYTTNSVLASELEQQRQELTVRYALRVHPEEERKRVTNSRHLERPRGQKVFAKAVGGRGRHETLLCQMV